jgi:hypothetical protein
MELQLFGLIIDFLGTILLLLSSDPVMTNKKLEDGKEKSKEQIIKRYSIKRRFALIIIVLGFVIQVVAISL